MSGPAKKELEQNIKIAADNCIFTVMDGTLHILLIRMKKQPFSGLWAMPGGLIRNRETPDAAARRILKEQTGVSDVYLEQLYTFGSIKRDPLRRVVSIAYFALIPSHGVRLKTTQKYTDIRWWPFAQIPKRLAYDHGKIAGYAKKRLEWKIEYSNVVWSLLPARFTLTEMQEVYESILGRRLDKRNFRKKILSLGLIAATGQTSRQGAHRPAMLYRFTSKKPRIVEIL